MIYGWEISTKRIRHSKLFADANRSQILDFAMPRDSAGSLGAGIVMDAMFGALAEKNAAVRFQMSN